MPKGIYKRTNKHKEAIGKALRGKKKKPFTLEHRKNLSESHKGQAAWNKGRKTGYGPWKGKKRPSPSVETRKKMSKALKGRVHSEETKQKMREAQLSLVKAGRHPMWRGGITPERTKIWKSKEYQQWRKAVFERDNYTCQCCGERGGTLNADHIKPFSTFPELRFELSNGRTLCVQCHRKTPTYGGNAMTHLKYAEKVKNGIESICG